MYYRRGALAQLTTKRQFIQGFMEKFVMDGPWLSSAEARWSMNMNEDQLKRLQI